MSDPLSDLEGLDAADRDSAESRKDVRAQKALVARAGLGLEMNGRLRPTIGPPREGDPGQLRIDPLSTGLVGLHGREESESVALPPEHTGALAAIGTAVAGPVTISTDSMDESHLDPYASI